jgi:hypothetical protein
LCVAAAERQTKGPEAAKQKITCAADAFAAHFLFFLTQLPQVPALVLYQLVLVNYGEFVSADDAETFGASALGTRHFQRRILRHDL